MIKAVLLIILVLQAFADQGAEDKKVRLNVNNELVLPAFTSTDTPGNIIVQLSSLPGNDATIPITV
jgi:hypothetical protein